MRADLVAYGPHPHGKRARYAMPGIAWRGAAILLHITLWWHAAASSGKRCMFELASR